MWVHGAVGTSPLWSDLDQGSHLLDKQYNSVQLLHTIKHLEACTIYLFWKQQQSQPLLLQASQVHQAKPLQPTCSWGGIVGPLQPSFPASHPSYPPYPEASSEPPVRQVSLASLDLLSSWCEEEVSRVLRLFSFSHPYWKRKAVSPPFFIQDILTAIAQLHIHTFVSCSHNFFPPTLTGSLHVLFLFLTERIHSISPSLLFIPVPDTSWSLSPLHKGQSPTTSLSTSSPSPPLLSQASASASPRQLSCYPSLLKTLSTQAAAFEINKDPSLICVQSFWCRHGKKVGKKEKRL